MRENTCHMQGFHLGDLFNCFKCLIVIREPDPAHSGVELDLYILLSALSFCCLGNRLRIFHREHREIQIVTDCLIQVIIPGISKHQNRLCRAMLAQGNTLAPQRNRIVCHTACFQRRIQTFRAMPVSVAL